MSYDLQGILDYLVIISPTVAAVLGVVLGFIKIVKAGRLNLKEIKKEIEELKAKYDKEKQELNEKNTELKDVLVQVLEQNAELKSQNEELKVVLTGERRA